MLRQRVITAMLMLAVLVPAIFHPSIIPFGILTIVLISAAVWEWANLNQYANYVAVFSGLVCAVALTLAWSVGWLDLSLWPLWLSVGGAWVLISGVLLQKGVAVWATIPKLVRLVGGIFAIGTAWFAVMKARTVGVNFLFSVMALVWVADIFAYTFGRIFGGKWITQKLAPSISPGKSWEGALGGLFGVLLLAFVWLWADSEFIFDSKSMYTLLFARLYWLMPIAVLLLGVMSVAGDLLESLFKRSAGVKDSSGLLPGHGGVLDRVDALLPVLPLAMMLMAV
jgi:phosphatidate cytidylyltransferase